MGKYKTNLGEPAAVIGAAREKAAQDTAREAYSVKEKR
jgi:hypothetical protein